MRAVVLPEAGESSETGAVALLRRARASRLVARLANEGHDAASRTVLHSLHRLGQAQPDDLVDLVSDPGVGVRIDCDRIDGAFAQLALRLAWRHMLGNPVDLRPIAVWSMEDDFQLEPKKGASLLRFENGHLGVFGAGGVHRLRLVRQPASCAAAFDVVNPFPSIVHGQVLGLFDPNPMSMEETHPDKRGNAISLGARPLSTWLESLAGTFGSLSEIHPELHGEMKLLLRCVHPTGSHDEKQLSASFREYVGAVYVTLHPRRLSTLEALVHEFQHAKLNLLAQHYDLLENAWSPFYPSPVRPDPRPLMGVLLAAHAFVAVAEIYRRMLAANARDASLTSRFAEIVACNESAIASLRAHAAWTLAGRALFDELERWHATHLSTVGPSLPRNVEHEI